MVIIIMERKMENLIEQYDRDQIANLLQNKKIKVHSIPVYLMLEELKEMTN